MPLTLLHCSDSQYAAFTVSDFDANDYANAILAVEPYPPTTENRASQAQQKPSLIFDQGREDLSVAISKLTLNVDEVGKQLRNVVRVSTVLYETGDAYSWCGFRTEPAAMRSSLTVGHDKS